MAEIDLEAVVEFLRRNGLSESESALVEDVLEKSDPGASLLENFFFPMAPPPPPLWIPSSRRIQSKEEMDDRVESSDDEFVSLGSSTTGLSSSEFINPYGIRTTGPPSQASSDGMSQFGTARDFHDFDMQNGLFWYNERDEDYAMPPLFVDTEFDGDPSEDKYVMAMQSDESTEKQVLYSDMLNASNSKKKLKEQEQQDYHDLGEHFLREKGNAEFEEHQNTYSCSSLLCACCDGRGIAYQHNAADADYIKLRGTDSNYTAERNYTDDWSGNVNTSLDLQNEGKTSENDNHGFVQRDGPKVQAVDGNQVSDELLIYQTNDDDDYEEFDLRIIHRRNRTGFEENRDFPVVINSIIAGRYYVMEFLGSAAFSKVVQAYDLHLGMNVCLKIIKNNKDFFDQSLDEIKLLKLVNKHDPADAHHILRLYDYFYFMEHLIIVTELLKENLYEFQKFIKESGGEPYFTMHRLQIIARQCLEAVLYLHDLGIIHCDLKPENILIKSYRRCEIKIIDLGSSCFLTDHLSPYVQSRSYRAPEVMLGLPYDQKIDIWSIGCILAELYSGEVLFPNEAVAIILARIIALLGPIDMDMLQNGQDTHKYFTENFDIYFVNEESNELDYIIPDASSLEDHLQVFDTGFIDFLKCLLEINPSRRPTAEEALQHPWLDWQYEAGFAGK